MQNIRDYIAQSPNIQFGKLCFKNTRVPLQSLFWHLEKGYTIDGFIENFPTVSKEQAEAVLEWLANNFPVPNNIQNETTA